MRRSLRRARGGVPLAVLALVAACGDSRPPLLGSSFADGTDAGGADDAGAGGALNLESGIGPSCSAGPEGGVCGCLELSLLGDAPNLYFVLDRSGSMNDGGKWQTVRAVVADVMHRIGPRARFGAAVFPDPRTQACGPGVQVMAPRLGDAPAGTYGDTTAFFSAATNTPAGGGTPTAATIAALAPSLEALQGKTYVILATDGGPNCNPNESCDVSACIPNIESAPGCTPNAPPNCCASDPASCLDTEPTVQAIAALAKAGVATYVIGVPGSGPYAAVLDRMAFAGGTARPTEPYYFAVSTTDTAALTTALGAIAAQITGSCTLQLQAPPPDPSQVNVYLDGAVVPQDPQNGWTLSGATITLVGDTCTRVTTGQALSLRVVAGCPTVIK